MKPFCELPGNISGTYDLKKGSYRIFSACYFDIFAYPEDVSGAAEDVSGAMEDVSGRSEAFSGAILSVLPMLRLYALAPVHFNAQPVFRPAKLSASQHKLCCLMRKNKI